MRIALMSMVALVAACSAPAPTGSISWIKDYDTGRKQAKDQGKPIMIFFTADW